MFCEVSTIYVGRPFKELLSTLIAFYWESRFAATEILPIDCCKELLSFANKDWQ